MWCQCRLLTPEEEKLLHFAATAGHEFYNVKFNDGGHMRELGPDWDKVLKWAGEVQAMAQKGREEQAQMRLA